MRVASRALCALLVMLAAAGTARAQAPIELCVPEAPRKPVLTPNSKGECTPTKTVQYAAIALPGGAELATLDALLPHLVYLESGVAGKPTVELSGVNVQIVDGEGKTATANGAGNLVIGYDENPGGHEQSGSHDLVLGEEQTFTSYGGVLDGYRNAIISPFASVTGGEHNTASGKSSSVSGGTFGTAGALGAAVSGGLGNHASAYGDSVSGGRESTAAGLEANWIGGGYKNSITGAAVRRTSIFGGKELSATLEYEALP